VSKTHRRQGIAIALINELKRIGAARGAYVIDRQGLRMRGRIAGRHPEMRLRQTTSPFRTTTAPKGCSQLAAPAFASSIAIAIAMKCSCWLAIRESPESRHYRDPVSVAQLGGGRNIFARYLVHYEDESGKALVRVMTFQQRPDRMPEVVTSIDWS
jgi:hypothetical protein